MRDDDGYDAADDSRKSYDLAIVTLRERLEAFRCERIGPHRLYLGDCQELLPLIRADVTITDLPYAQKTHEGARTGGGDEVLVDFSSITEETFLTLCRNLCAATDRWVVMTCDWVHAAEAQKQLPEIFIRSGIWVKPNGMPQYTGDRPAMGWEAVAILHRPGRKRWNGGGAHAVWTVPKVNGEHPTQKPLKLIADWVQVFSDPGETVLDPFMGSATTGVACAKLGRKFIGIEQDARYFDIACARLEDADKQPDLFVAPEPKPKQLSFMVEG